MKTNPTATASVLTPTEARGSFYRNAHVEESVGHALLALEAVTISAVISVGGFVAGVAAVSTGLNVYTFGEFSAWARHTCRTRFPWLRVPIDEEKLAREQAIVDEIWQRSDAEGAERAEARERRRAERARSQSARRQVWEDWKQRQLDRWGLGGLSDLTDRLEESKAESTGPPGQEREPEGGPGGHEKAR